MTIVIQEQGRKYRKRLAIEGIVQGVGFRPFVYQAATVCQLSGWVLNDSRGVTVEAEGQPDQLESFIRMLREDYPPLASISSFSVTEQPPIGESGFLIRHSEAGSEVAAQISPDTFVCNDCLEELFDPDDRRHRYAFINCTNCGPRYTIVTGVPYDRPLTTMVDFPMCPDCQAEYDDPTSRRFHAQPNACPVCGPQLQLQMADGSEPVGDPLQLCIDLLRAGKIVAIKGLGGFHLAVDAASDQAVAELRRRKGRDEKPFALMVADLEQAEKLVEIEDREQRLLCGVERPIVLLRSRPENGLSPRLAPANRYLGLMLPYTPLHHLLLQPFRALVMTSANLSDEPIAYRDSDAKQRLAGIADAYLLHNRRIETRADDSIARVMAGQALLLRRSRGYVPRGVKLPAAQPSVLAVGAELKNSLCLTRVDRAYLSQHIGDLKNSETLEALQTANGHLQRLLDVRPQLVAHDLHPDYASTRFAEQFSDLPQVAVQHHHAHLVSCLAEHGESGPALGVIFDGIGYGRDGTVWGGEFLLGDAAGFERLGHLAQVPMPGGDAATREPYRMALSYLLHSFGDQLPELPLLQQIPAAELKLLRQMINRGLNSPQTSSCGRLFDAVSALVGLRQRVSYEGQAALELEMSIIDGDEQAYRLALQESAGLWQLDPTPMVRALVTDLQDGVGIGIMAARFHNGLAASTAELCSQLRSESGIGRVVLSGGVFQNRYLTERLSALLEKDHFSVLRHSLVPPNDGGIALGQAVVAGHSAI